MTFVDLGGGDWLGLDVDEVLRVDRAAELEEALIENRQAVVAAIGAEYEVEVDDDGKVLVVVDSGRWYEAEVGRNGRLIFTGNQDPNGPL